MSKKTALIISIILNLIFLSLFIFYEKEDKRYISKISEKDNISMLKIVGEDTEVIKQVPQTGQWVMSYTCDDENAKLYWNEKKRTVVAKNISATECTLIFRENDAIFRMISMYVDGEYVTELDETKKYEMESYECTNGEELTWDIKTNKLSIEPILEDTSCYVNFNEIILPPTLTEKILAAEEAISDANIDYSYTSEGEIYVNTDTGPANSNNENIKSKFLSKKMLASSVELTATESQITNGLYYTEENTEGNERVYFYRGAVENNYVIFGDYCWRIVRTVEDGSVRLRYGGIPTQNGETYTCPQTGTAVNIATYQSYNASYNNKSYANYKTSDIRTTVENWYSDNIWKNGQNTKVTNLIADTPYCNDMSERVDGSIIRFGAYDRLNRSGTNAYNPQYKCPSSTYAYTVAKGDLTYPIALLTADEVAYAGGVYDVYNKSYYLYTGQGYWTMSPPSFTGTHAYVFYVGYSGDLDDHGVNYNIAAVPAVSLKPEAAVKRGTGAYNDPYVINTD